MYVIPKAILWDVKFWEQTPPSMIFYKEDFGRLYNLTWFILFFESLYTFLALKFAVARDDTTDFIRYILIYKYNIIFRKSFVDKIFYKMFDYIITFRLHERKCPIVLYC